MLYLESGKIRRGKYPNLNIDWPIEADCEYVHVLSSFHLGYWDKVIIDGINYDSHDSYDGTVNQIAPSHFIIQFTAYYAGNLLSGFELNWTCIEFDVKWEEWTHAADGTCKDQRQLSTNKTIGEFLNFGIEYKTRICSKLIH